MAEVIGRGIIEVVADARQLKASLEEAKKAIRTLGEGQTEVSKAAQRSIDQYIGRLQQQNAVLGMSVRQTELFKLAQRGASNEQLAAANAALRVKERHEQIATAGRIAQTVLFGVAGAAAAAATAYATLAVNNAKFADRLRELSASTDIAVEDLAGLTLLAKQNGLEIDDLAKAINKMSLAMAKSPEAFEALGVTAKDNVGALKQISDIFKNLPDLQERNLLAQKIFSKSWAELAPILKLGGEEIGRVVERGKQLSGITEDMTAKADDFLDSLEELKISMAALGSEIIPVFGNIVKAMVAARTAGEGFFSTFHEGAKQAFADIMRLNTAGDLNNVSKQIADTADLILEQERLRERGAVGLDTYITRLREHVAALQKKRDQLEAIGKLEKEPEKAKPPSTAAAAAAAKQAEAERLAAVKRFTQERDEQLTLIKQIAEARAAAAEHAIALELAHRQARLAGQEEMLSAQRELALGELQAIGKRVQLVEQAFETEQRLIRAKTMSVQASDAALLGAAKKLYDGLVARDIEYLNIVKANRQKIAALDQEVADSRKRTAEFVKGANREGLSEEQQRQEAFRDAVEVESNLRAAVISGDIKRQKELSAEALRTAEALKSLGEGDVGVRFAEEAQRLNELGLAAQALAAGSEAAAAESASKNVEARMAKLATQIRDVQENALKDMEISLSKSSVQSLIAELKAAIAAEEFIAKITPQVQAPSTIPALAGGGRAHGLALVGERGPELVRFLSPAQVYAASETKRILGAMRGIPRLAEGGIVRPAQEQAHDVVDVNLRSGNKVATVSTPRDQLHTLLDIVREFSE